MEQFQKGTIMCYDAKCERIVGNRDGVRLWESFHSEASAADVAPAVMDHFIYFVWEN